MRAGQTIHTGIYLCFNGVFFGGGGGGVEKKELIIIV